MAPNRSRIYKKRATGGQMPVHQKKRAHQKTRPAAATRIGKRHVKKLRCHGGNYKLRALRVDSGRYTWTSQDCCRITRILGVVYNAASHELVRTNTLVKNAIVYIDATPFKQWLEQRFGVVATKTGVEPHTVAEDGKPNWWKAEQEARRKARRDRYLRTVPKEVLEQLQGGKILACISSRPGQTGEAGGYILEGPEYEFYSKKIHVKKGTKI
eukprot:Trichotokara_eunicae@DN5449_c0_g1_i11.p1